MGKTKLSLQQIAAADQGEAAALKMLDEAIVTYRKARTLGTRTEALVAINNGVILSVQQGAALNVVGMLSAAIAKLGDQAMNDAGEIERE